MKRTKKQQEILDKATLLFYKKGYVETSMRDLASELGIQAPSLYSHFKSKEQILLLLIEDTMAEFRDLRLSIIESSDKPAIKFRNFLRGHLLCVLKNVPRFEVMLKNWKIFENDTETIEKYRLVFKNYVSFVDNLLADVLNEDHKINGFTDDATARIILENIHFIPKVLSPDVKEEDFEEIINEVEHRLLKAYL